MSSEQIIMTNADLTAIGGDPAAPGPIMVAERQAIQPMPLIDGTWALPPVALESISDSRRDYLSALIRRLVDEVEFQRASEAEITP